MPDCGAVVATGNTIFHKSILCLTGSIQSSVLDKKQFGNNVQCLKVAIDNEEADTPLSNYQIRNSPTFARYLQKKLQFRFPFKRMTLIHQKKENVLCIKALVPPRITGPGPVTTDVRLRDWAHRKHVILSPDTIEFSIMKIPIFDQQHLF